MDLKFGLKPRRFIAGDDCASGPGSGVSLKLRREIQGAGKITVTGLQHESLHGKAVRKHGNRTLMNTCTKRCGLKHSSILDSELGVKQTSHAPSLQRQPCDVPILWHQLGPNVTGPVRDRPNGWNNPWLSNLLFVRSTRLRKCRV